MHLVDAHHGTIRALFTVAMACSWCVMRSGPSVAQETVVTTPPVVSSDAAVADDITAPLDDAATTVEAVAGDTLEPGPPAATMAVSVGSPSKGWLINGVQLQDSERVKVRDNRNFGTPELVYGIMGALDVVHQRFPDTPRLVIGDISRAKGGAFKPHLSHQSGRDADVGFYFKGIKAPVHLAKGRASNLDLPRTWAFVEALIESGGVQYIFLDYTIQKLLYDHASAHGRLTSDELNKAFQYPRGRRSRMGVIRWSKGHDDHMHIRFHARQSVANARLWVERHGEDALDPVPVHYRVKRGDNLGKIARKHRVSVKQIRSWNKVKRERYLKIGRRLVVGWKRPVLPPL